ncbi:MauE/DoxX family redox-associated membrane protein [Lentzea sp. NPDC051213]|uniref:MauE/DoxX family redox-associated membrane protein n=1 Tax=Lentzea sp. NPDC051213 TaxID=3364126 RepID=UPI0037B2C27C
MDYVALACRVLVGAVFVVSFATKVSPGALQNFAESLRDMKVLPASVVRMAAVGVVVAEAAVVGMLAWPASVRAGAVLAGLLLVAFSAAIALSLAQNTKASCRCFGAGGGRLGVRHVVRNVFLFGAAGVVVAGGGTAPADAAMAVAAAGAGAVAALFVLGMDPVVELFGRRGDVVGEKPTWHS